MKELSIEEKAKRFDEALEKARRYYDEYKTRDNILYVEDMEDMFPELKESEDEKIIKAIKSAVLQLTDIYLQEKYGLKQSDCIAWLEKQGEQKPADNTEPKFHKGDWVVYCNDDVDLITGVEENGYCINNGGYIPFVCENEMRLWDITDAKVGDVLVSESTCGLGTWYCIFKSLDGDESMTVYCYLARDGRFETKKELCFDKDPYNTKPATKEQCDLLFQKMHEAGYEWDAEKKELKKIEQNPTQEIEPFEAEHGKYYYCIKDYFCGGRKQASKGDVVQALRGLPIMGLKDASEYFLPVNFIKCYSTWSEEDEYIIEEIEAIIDAYVLEENNPKALIDWLKSLKERYTWRPSDGELECLGYAIEKAKKDWSPLTNNRIYLTLKALKEQLLELRGSKV